MNDALNTAINSKYTISNKKIGTGGFSEVFMGNKINSGQIIAIKKVSLKNKDIKRFDKLNMEISFMKKLSHPNIVKYLDIHKTNDYWYIIMEYCNMGTLDNIINYNEQMSKKIDFNREANSHYYLNQIKDALFYLRDQGCIHRDIKPMNVLLTRGNGIMENINYDINDDIIVKIADFGLARSYYDNKESLMQTMCGSPLYMAPEIFINKKYNSKIDLWAFGLIMYQLLYGIHPQIANSYDELVENLRSKNIDFHLEKNFTQQCFNLISGLLEKNPENRINWPSFFNHEWFYIWNNKRSVSVPISINTLNTDIPTLNSPNLSISPLGPSNLSKMKMNAGITRQYNRGSYFDYPSSCPILEKSIYHNNIEKSQSFEQQNKYISTSRSRIFNNFK